MHYSISVTKRQRERIPLLLRSVGISHLQEPIRRPNGFPLWQIFYCESGVGEFFVDGERGVLHPGQIAILEPQIPHGYRNLSGDWIVHFIGFDGEACRKLLTFLKLFRPGIYTLSDSDLFLSHLKTLHELASPAKPQHIPCSKELYSLLLDLSGGVRRLPMNQAAEGSAMVKEMILYLEDHFSEDLSLGDLSEQFHKTPEYLCSCFKSVTGETILQNLRRIRIHHAKVLLMERPDTGIQEISRSCGFSSVSYFGKVFREATGYTPQGYRLGVKDSKQK